MTTKDPVLQEEDEVVIKCNNIVKSFEAALENTENKDVLMKFYEEIKSLLDEHPDIIDIHLGKAYIEGHLGLVEEARNTLLSAKHLDEERVTEMLEGLKYLNDDDNDESFDEEVFDRFINEDGEATEKFKSVLKEIFDKFSTNKKSLSDDDINEYHKHVNGEPITEEALSFLKSGPFEVDENSCLTLNGFIEFYALQTFNTLSETIKDIKKFGYDENLEKIKKSDS